MQDMSKNELSMEELGQVSGGYRIEIVDINRGDCFTDHTGRYYARGNHNNVRSEMWIELDWYNTGGHYKGIKKKQVMMLERNLIYNAALSDRNYSPR